jgi:hypothetical protein
MNSAETRRADCVLVGLLIALIAGFICGGCGDESNGPVNRPPVITGLEASPEVIEPLESSAVTCSADDPDGDALGYAWNASCGSLSGNGPSVTWNASATFDTCLVTVIVSDGRGGADTAEVSVEVPEGTLLIQTHNGLAAVSLDGSYFLYPDISGPVEVLGDRVFVKSTWSTQTILEIDKNGATIRSMTLPSGSSNYTIPTVLPNGGFAVLDNKADSIYFADPEGNPTQAIAMPGTRSTEFQVVDGIVVGNRLVVSENGDNQIIEIDLGTYQGSVFRDFAGLANYLSGIDYSRGLYYLCDSNDDVSTFTESGPLSPLTTLDGILFAITVVGDYAYVTAYGSGTLYKVNINSGGSEVFLEGLSFPEDIEYVPLAMEPPPGR